MVSRLRDRSRRRPIGLGILGVLGVLGIGIVVSVSLFSGGGGTTGPGGGDKATGSPGSDAATLSPALPTIAPTPTPAPPLGGTELYGFLPYWVMPDVDAAYLGRAPVSRIALFSVTARNTGELHTGKIGYRRIVSETGTTIIHDAHHLGTAVDLVFTSFGEKRNSRFFGGGDGPEAETAPWHRTVTELVQLVRDLKLDGINVDVERLDPLDRAGYAAFLAALGEALRAQDPDARLSVATEASELGAAKAAAAIGAGVDRAFLMGYDYHWSGSKPGASSPVDRLDGVSSLRQSIEWYVEAGVPRDRVLLGLPLYGMTWRTTGPDRTWPVVGNGIPWIPADHLDVLLGDGFAPMRDPLEWAEYFVVPDGEDWLITYYDSPATLRAKMALARDAGLAGAGFWALGYEVGLPGYRALMNDFRNGDIERDPLR
jgi:Glycosyl hydrolases family 18